MADESDEASVEEIEIDEEYIRSANDQEQRRIIRKEVKKNYETIIDNRQALCNIHDPMFNTLLEKVKDMSKDTKHTRELQYDIGCVRELSHAIKTQAYTLCDVSTRFNSNDLSYNIKSKFAQSTNEINWTKLGKQAKILFTSTPVFTTMVGPLLKETKVRKVAVRGVNKSQNVATTVAENVHQPEGDNEEENEATNTRVKRLKHFVESHQKFDMLRTIINPANHVQSIENFFDFSYLHKLKNVIHTSDAKTGLLTGKYCEAEDLEDKEKKQMVLSISIKDLKEMSTLLYPGYEACKDTYKHPLHRDDPLYHTQTAQEQIEILNKRTADSIRKHQKNSNNNTNTIINTTTNKNNSSSKVSNSHRNNNNSTTTTASIMNCNSNNEKVSHLTIHQKSPNENNNLNYNTLLPTNSSNSNNICIDDNNMKKRLISDTHIGGNHIVSKKSKFKDPKNI